MTGATVTVLYPSEGDPKFDMDYYLKSHMPLVTKNWTKHGLKGYQVTKYAGTADGTPIPFIVQAALQWESIEHFKTAGSLPETAEVMGDVPKFTTAKPVIIVGEELQTSP